MNEITEQTVRAVIGKARSITPTRDDFLAALKQPVLMELSPWELWALIGFGRHERRQKWVGYIVESKLKGSGSELSSAGALAHPDGIEQEGDVPDNPGWRYFFHGSGCCLTHIDGTSIDVDFAKDGSAVEIDPYFYSAFLFSVPKPDWSDAQLCRARPLENAWQFEIISLCAAGFLDRKVRFCLTTKGKQLVERLEPIVDEINSLAQETSAETRLKMGWLLTTIGDVGSAVRAISQTSGEIANALSQAADVRVKERAALLGQAIRSTDESERRLALSALAALGRQHVEAEVVRSLECTSPSAMHLLSLQIVESWNDPSCEPMLMAALHRFAPSAGIFGTLLWRRAPEKDQIERLRNSLLVVASRLLLSYHTPPSIPKITAEMLCRVLEGDRKARDSEAGFLLYLLSPAAGLLKIKSNLRNKVPITREEAAIFLGMIGTNEAINSLLEVAVGPPESGGHEAACVLSMLTDERAVTAAANWNRRNDGYDEAEGSEIEFNGRKVKTWKMDEVMRMNMQSLIQGCSDRLHREYAPLLSKWSQS